MKWLAFMLVVACSAPATIPPPAKPTPPVEVQMKPYFLVVLRRGPAWTAEQTPETQKLGQGHMANIIAMEKAGKLVIAGPTDVPETDRTAVAGIFIFDNVDRPGLDALLAGDPAIAAGRFVPEVLTWYGPAGLTYAGKQ